MMDRLEGGLSDYVGSIRSIIRHSRFHYEMDNGQVLDHMVDMLYAMALYLEELGAKRGKTGDSVGGGE